MLNKEQLREAGKHFSEGVVDTILKWVVIFFLIGLAISFFVRFTHVGMDDTDSRQDGKISGLRPRTDYGTGCQYLETRDGAITPRLGRDGKQVCR